MVAASLYRDSGAAGERRRAGPLSLLGEVCGRGQLSVALAASDMPALRAGVQPPLGQIAAWAGQGFGRLGVVRLWWRDYQTRLMNGRHRWGFRSMREMDPGDRELFRAWWGSHRRRATAVDLAHQWHWRRGVALRPGGVDGANLARYCRWDELTGRFVLTVEVAWAEQDTPAAARVAVVAVSGEVS